MSGTGKFIETGSRLEFGVKEERGNRERGMGFHFEVKKMFQVWVVMILVSYCKFTLKNHSTVCFK